MATVLLSAVGTILGGPLGGAIGAVIGQQVDRTLLVSGTSRQGPRIKELDVQTSSYGTQIPAIFGTMRVAGTVIWSTDLIERSVKTGGSKNRPSTVNYSYSASFAVALSSRPVARIGRIWADGNLLRGAAGDFKNETGFRFYDGHGNQPVDPLLSAAEMPGLCPAYRGLAYAVFEDFQLADFGNRIPSLTFEVIERELSVPFHEIAASASNGAIVGNSNFGLDGFAVQGPDCRTALQPLMSVLPVFARPLGNALALCNWTDANVTHQVDNPAISDGHEKMDRPTRTREPQSRAPASLAVRHYEPERDFQAGIQTSRIIGSGQNSIQIELPASLSASTARALANANLMQLWRGLNGMKSATPYSATAIRAGDWLALGANQAPLRITDVEHLRGSTRVAATEWHKDNLHNSNTDPGRNLPSPDLPIGETRLIVLDLPTMGVVDPGRAVIAIAAAGTAAGWKRAALSIVDDGRDIELGGTQGVAVMGHLLQPLAPHTPHLLDLTNTITVRLLHDGMTLPPGSGDPTAFDAPALWLNGEIIRYASAQKIAPRDYRISGLLRGCFGTNSDVARVSGDDAVLLDRDTVLELDSIPLPLGAAITIYAQGIGDATSVQASATVEGNAIRPLAPVHGTASVDPDGGLSVTWKRRDRLPYGWVDGADVPNSEGVEDYTVELYADGLSVAAWSISDAAFSLTAAEWSSLAIPQTAIVHFSVIQHGRYAQSSPLLIAVQP